MLNKSMPLASVLGNYVPEIEVYYQTELLSSSPPPAFVHLKHVQLTEEREKLIYMFCLFFSRCRFNICLNACEKDV